jgi:two-component system, chemotaxis family, chemotaxis protein CheY
VAIDTTMKVLVVDDMTTMRKIIKKMLKDMGFETLEEANDGKPAWQMLQDAHEAGLPFQFIVSDWNMPGMTGLDLLTNVRGDERFSKVPFLMITAEAEQANVITAVKAGVSNYVVKPFNQATLKLKIGKIFP